MIGTYLTVKQEAYQEAQNICAGGRDALICHWNFGGGYFAQPKDAPVDIGATIVDTVFVSENCWNGNPQ